MGLRQRTEARWARAAAGGVFTRPSSRTAAAARRRRRARGLLGGVRQPGGQAGRLPARRPGRRLHDPTHAAALRPGALPHRSCSTSAAAAAARPTPATRGATRPGTWSPTSSGCASTSASTAGWSSAAPGAAPWRSPTPRRTPSGSRSWCCAASSLLRPKRAALVLPGRRLAGCFPDAWERFLAPIPEDERGDLIAAYHDRLTDPDPAVRGRGRRGLEPAGRARPSRCCRTPAASTQLRRAGVRARLRADREPLLRQRRLPRARASSCATRTGCAHIPGVIVQGRYDVATPGGTAPGRCTRPGRRPSSTWSPDAGHAFTSPASSARADRGHGPLRRARCLMFVEVRAGGRCRAVPPCRRTTVR